MKIRAALLYILGQFFFQEAYPQTAYYDALALKADLNGTVALHIDTNNVERERMAATGPFFKDFNRALKILQPYTDSAGTGIPFNSTERIAHAFADNPFLSPYLSIKRISASYLGSVISQAGGVNVTSFADGLAKLIVSRVKQDLNTYFFEKFQVFLDQKCPELKTLFPYTDLLVNHFASTDYANILNTLREAFDKDLHNLLSNIPKLNNLSTDGTDMKVNNRIRVLQKFFASNVGKIFLSSATIGNGLISGQKFPDLVDTVVRNYLSNWLDSDLTTEADIRGGVNLFAILSRSMRNNMAGINYIRLGQMDSLLSESITKNFYFGLIWQQIHNKKVVINSTEVEAVIARDASGIITYLSALIQNGASLSSAMNDLSVAKKKGESDLSTYYTAVFESEKVLWAAAENIQLINPELSFPPALEKIFSYGADITDIAHDISVRSYNAAIIGLLKYITDILPAGQFPGLDTALQNFIKYVSFAANVVTAKNSDEVQNALEAFALPASSALVQRNSYFGISINAYGGGFFGIEHLAALKKGANSWSGGVTAPVGFAFTFGNIGRSNNLKNPNGKSITLFIPLIDIGALAAFRFQNDSSSTAATVQLKNIVAPGAYLYFGFGKCPLSIGLGAQVGPQLRSISATDINEDKNFYVRYGLDLLIDIPLFNLYTNSSQNGRSLFSKR